MRVLAVIAVAAGGVALCPRDSARADEIVFKKEFGGGKVKCEIYKEDKDYIHYIDVKRKMDCGCSKEIVEKVVREKKPLINVEQFFLQKAKDAKGKKAREKAQAIAEELRKKREAEEKKNKGKKGETGENGERRVGKCLIKPTTEKTGIKILRTKDTGSNEILVDPFPDEEAKPKTGTKSETGTKTKKPAKPRAKRKK
jgi:hypothetical protein